MLEVRVLDCNCSIGRTARPPFRYAATSQELLAEMDFCGIDRALVYHTNQRFSASARWNDRLVQAVSTQDRLEPAWVILPSVTDEMPTPNEWLASMKVAGVRALWAFPQEHHYHLDRRTFPGLFEAITDRRIPLFVKENVCNMAAVMAEAQEATIVLVNQGPHSVERFLRPLFDKYDNLHLETSYLIIEGLIEEFVDRYGPRRLLFGSGFPDNCSGAALLRLMAADIDARARAAIAAENLQRLLNEVQL